MVIGIDKTCYKRFYEDNTKISIDDSPEELTWGYGTFMAIYRISYRHIQDYFKIWVGDEIQFYNNNHKSIKGIYVETIMSETIKSLNIQYLAEIEKTFYDKYCNKDGSIRKDVTLETINMVKQYYQEISLKFDVTKERNKFGIIYNIFDETSILKIALENSRKVADYICVVYQNVSYTGIPSNYNIYSRLKEFKDQGLIDSIVSFVPNMNVSPKLNEVKKRNIGTNYCDKALCTHYLSIDADELFKTQELEYAKQFMYNNPEYDMSVCKMLTYYHDQTTILDPPEKYYIPFIIKMYDRRFVKDLDIVYNMDHGRSISYSKCKEFLRNEIQMHHYSFVMKDIETKLENQPTQIKEEIKKRILTHYNKFERGQKALTNNGYFNTKYYPNEFSK
jgi:hypothetical protein